MQLVEVQRFFPVSVDKVWARYTDHRAWARFVGTVQVTLQPEGRPEPNGVGCVRVFTLAGREVVAEEVTAFEPPARMTYRIVRGGGLLRNHAGEVLLVSEGEGCRLTWRCRFDSPVPGLGPLLRLGIAGFFRRVLRSVEADLAARP